MQHPVVRLVSGLAITLVLLATFAAPVARPEKQASAATRTLYVDPSGSDSTGTGTASKPWKSIGKAVQFVTAGDVVLIGSGSYAESVTIEEKHGTAINPIEFRANGNVVIDGAASSRDAVFVTYSSHVILDGWTVRDAPRAGLRIDASQHITVRNGTFADNGRWGIFTDFSDDLLIENNQAYGSKLEHGIYHSNSGDRPTIRGNVIHGNYAAGLHMNADASMGGDGIISGALVEDNVIYDNGTGGGAAINMDGITDSVVRNNLLYNNRASGIAIFRIDGAVCSQNNRFLHNTIVMPSNGRWAVTVPGADCVDNRFFNNIFWNDHSYRGAISLGAWPISGFQSDYNIVLDRFTTNDGNSRLTLAQWQALGNDAHARIATPAQLFVAPGSDFHLKNGSPAIDAGRELSGVTSDLDGNNRPRGSGYDAGAYESGGGPATATPSAAATAAKTAIPSSTPTRTASPTNTATKVAPATPVPGATASPTASATPAVSPRCSIDPGTVRVATRFRVTCRGFLPGESVSLFWDDPGAKPLTTGTTDNAGSLALSAKAPASGGGRHKTIARGETSGKRVSNSVTVQPRIAISPNEGPSNTRVTVELSGFKAGETVSIRFYTTSTRYTTVRHAVTVSATGGARFAIVVPGGVAAGGHKVEARGSSGSSAATMFDVSVTQVRQADASEPTAEPEERPQRRPTFTTPPGPGPADSDEPIDLTH